MILFHRFVLFLLVTAEAKHSASICDRPLHIKCIETQLLRRMQWEILFLFSMDEEEAKNCDVDSAWCSFTMRWMCARIRCVYYLRCTRYVFDFCGTERPQHKEREREKRNSSNKP